MFDQQLQELVKKEGDLMMFEYLGLNCAIVRPTKMRHWCGYVGVSKGSRLDEKKDYYPENLDGKDMKISALEKAINNLQCHGGITFTGKGYWKNAKDDYYFGFDCAHYGDKTALDFDDGGEYRTKEYVICQVEKLAKQIKEILDLKL